MSAAPMTLAPAPPPMAVRTSQALARFLRGVALRLAPPQFGLMDLVGARWVSDALGALVRLGVPEALAGGPRTAAQLADVGHADVDALYRLLRALAQEGLLGVTPDARFSLTRLTDPLRADHPASMRNYVLNQTAAHNAATWSALHTSVRTGRRVWDDLFGADMWSWLSARPEDGAVFHGTMAEFTRDVAPSAARAYDFSRHRVVVDLGGGTGTLLAAILCAHPKVSGVLVDQVEVVAEATALLSRWGVADRAQVRAGDVFQAVPEGHDAYVAKHMLHGYDDDSAAEILRVWRRAIAPDGRLVLVEMVVPELGRPYLASLDLQMLVTSFGGRERTRGEWGALLRAGGFEVVAVHPTASPFDVIEARPV